MFISKSKQELNALVAFCEQESIDLTAHSFLNFSPLQFQVPENIECVFFSSPRAVRFFLAETKLKSSTLIAVAGKSTAKSIEELGYHVSFIPSESGKIQASTVEFKNWLGNRKVIFPTSTISNKSYSRNLNPEQFKLLEVYITKLVPKQIAPADILVFTSPSNVDGYFIKNKITHDCKVIAWGESTDKRLKHIFSGDILMLPESTEKELIKILKTI